MGTYAPVRLLLLSAVIALTTRGFPVTRKIMPSPLRKNRLATLLYPHRKLSRPWLVSMQEDLLKDGPSGDGPGDDMWSRLIPSAKSRVGYVSESEYKTQSPSAEDFFTSLALPFPTIIDTMMDESSSYGEELISRTSMPYEGPSSLLNSFIFRPSLPYLSSSSMKTPSLEESSDDSGSVFPSWWDPSSVWKMSTRQAVSDAISDHYFIITAISATHIYSESERTSYSDSIPSKLPSDIFSSFSTFLIQEDLVTTKTDSLIEVPSSASSETFKMLPAFSVESQIYSSIDNLLSSSHSLSHTHPFEEVHSSLRSRIFSSSSNISLGHFQTYFYSDTLSRETDKPYILTHSYSNDFDNSIFRDLSPSEDVSSYEIHRSTGLTFEQTWEKSVSLVDTQILYDFNISFYTTTPFMSFLKSNVHTTVTYVDNGSQSDRFVMPTLTILGTSSFSGYSDDLQETYISSPHPEKETEYPHIASSFTDYNDIIPVISLWSLDISSVENIISHEDTRTYIKEDSYSDESVKLKFTPEQTEAISFTPLTLHPVSTFLHSLFSENEIKNKPSLPLELSKFMSETVKAEEEYETPSTVHSEQIYTPSTVHSEQIYTPSREQMFSPQQDSSAKASRQSLMSEVESYRSQFLSEQSTPIPISYLKSASTLSVIHSVENYSAPVSTPISYLIASQSVDRDDFFSPMLIPSASALTISYESQQEMAPTIASAFEIMSTNDEIINEKGNLQTQYDSTTEFIDHSTHHVTVRSLSSSSLIDISESMLLNYVTSGDSDTGVPKLTSTYTLLPIITPSGSFENITNLEEKTLLQEEINTQEYSPTFLESSFQESKNLSRTSSIRAKYDVPYSMGSQELESHALPDSQSIKDFDELYSSLFEKEFITPLSPPVHSHIHEFPSLFTIISESDSKSRLIGGNGVHTSETLRTGELDYSEAEHFFFTKTLTSEDEFTSYPFESTAVIQDPLIHLKASVIKSVSMYEGPISTIILASQPERDSNEFFLSKPLESTVTDRYTQIKPSKTFQDSSDRSLLEDIHPGYLSTDKRYTLTDGAHENEYFITSKLTASEIKIESSMTFSRLMESEQAEMSHSVSKDDSSVSETPYIDIPSVDESMIFSAKGYLSEYFLHPSDSISMENILTRLETYVDPYHFTPTVPWDVSRHFVEYSTPKLGDRVSSFAQLLSEDGLRSVSGAPYESPVIGSDSRSSFSEIMSPLRPAFSYTQRDMKDSSYPSDIESLGWEGIISYNSDESFSSSTFYASSSTPAKVIGSDQESEYYFPFSEFIPNQPVATLLGSVWNDRIKSEITPKYLQSSLGFISVFTSRDKSDFYYDTPELKPYQTLMAHGESSWVNGFLPDIESRLLRSSLKLTDDESDIYSYASVFTPRDKVSASEKSIWIGGDISDTDSSHPERFVSLKSDFTPYDKYSFDQQVPDITLSSPVATQERSRMIGEQESEKFLSKVSSGPWDSFGDFLPRSFSFERGSKIYATPEMTPSQTMITHDKSDWIGGQHPQGEFLSKKELSFSPSYISDFTPEEESLFYQTPVFSLRTITREIPQCAISACPADPGSIFQSINEMTVLREGSHLLQESLSVLSTVHPIATKEKVTTKNTSHVSSLSLPKSVETFQSEHLQKTRHPTILESEYSFQKPEPESIESDFSFGRTVSVRKPDSKTIESDYPIKRPDPKSIESDYSVKRPDPKSVESDRSQSPIHPTKSVLFSSTVTLFSPQPDSKIIESHYPIKRPDTKSMESDYSTKRPDPKSIESDHSQFPIRPTKSVLFSSTLKLFSPQPDSKIIESDYPIKRPDTKSVESDYPFKKPEHKSLESNPSQFSIHPTRSVLFISTVTLFSSQPSRSLLMSSPVLSVLTAVTKPIASSELDITKLTPVSRGESSTLGYDIEMASVLAISSFFGINGSRNATTGLENSGISESEWSKTDVRPTPSIDLTLFKDNNYWTLTVLEAPVKGHLPENFSQILEIRLANAYSEAFRIRASKHGSNGQEEKVVVKILSLTNDLLLSQVDIVYVVERGGMLVPASIASEFLNFLRHEQLREFLGLYAILKAKPYRPDESAESHPVSSSIPVVTIVCSILGILLFLFCCFCVYCRCCRPKQAEEASPTSSASGSLQRSLAKHGQHNRKHLFQEMAHHLTTEMATQRKQESASPDTYVSEKEPPPQGKSLPPLPPKQHAEAIDKAIKMLKILENKEASISPVSGKRSAGKERSPEAAEIATEGKKTHPKPKKRRKAKEPKEKSSAKEATENGVVSDLRPLPPPPKEEEGKTTTQEENRASPDSGTSSRHTSSSPASTSEKTSEELGSYGSNTELLPPLQDLIAKSKADSEAAAADTQIHLSRVRQRISELLDDAFALANGRKFYGSMRSKKINPATEMFPRHGSLRSQSAAESSIARHEEEAASARRPISEGAQHLLGTITDDGHLITRPPPKAVWDHGEQEDTTADASKYQDVTEAHNRHVNFFPFQQQSKLREISSSSTSSLPMLDTLQESQVDTAASTLSTINVLREAASEVYLAHSSKIHPAVADQYDEIDVVSALREGEPVADLIRAIKDELQKFSGTNNESNA